MNEVSYTQGDKVMIYKVISEQDFINEFHNYGRQDQFSDDGLRALYEWLIEDGNDVELDVLTICCEWVEIHIDDLDREVGHVSFDSLADTTTVIELDDETAIYAVY